MAEPNLEQIAEHIADAYELAMALPGENAQLLDLLFDAVADLDIAGGHLESAKVRELLDFRPDRL